MTHPISHPTPSAWTSVVLDDVRQIRLESEGGEAGLIVTLTVPPGQAPEGGFPLLVVLDGDSLAITVAQNAVRLARRPAKTRIGPMVVVGIAREGGKRDGSPSRYADFTAGPPAEVTPALQGAVWGRADALLARIEGEVLALVKAQAPINAERIALMGHSLGGVFVLNALAAEASVFSSFVAVSPSIWWNPEAIEADFAADVIGSRRLLLLVGETEEATTGTGAGRAVVSRVVSLGAQLEALSPGQVEVHVAPDEDHGSMPVATLARALRFVSV